MKIIVSPDSFKECLPAPEVAAVIARATGVAHPGWEVVQCPLSDGGEGFSAILTQALGGDFVEVTVTGPLGNVVRAAYGRAGKTAIMDVASVAGLSLVPPERRDPVAATSRGVGEMILHAVQAGCRRILMGLGGSATCDGGEGMMQVPGLRDAAAGVEIIAFCDVDNPFAGPDGAARVFGPQKGAGPEMVERLEARMQRLAARMLDETGTDVTSMPHAGAAGGLGGALAAYLGASLESGADKVLDLMGFARLAEGADYIITGEGKSDIQTLSGKLPLSVLRHSGGVPVILMSGRIEDRAALHDAGFARLIEVSPPGMPLQTALLPEMARANLAAATDACLSE